MHPSDGGNMFSIENRKRYILGIDRIYEQNIDPAERLRFLEFAISLGKGQEIVSQIIYDLHDYAEETFNPDEDCIDPFLFDEYGRENRDCLEFRKEIDLYYFNLRMGVEIDALDFAGHLSERIRKYECRDR
jgi:hypothetical protein